MSEVRILGRRLGAFALIAAALTAAQLAIRAWIGYRGWFSLDDYVFYTRAAELPLFNRDLLFEAYNSHLMPGSMIWVWLSTRAAPLNFTVVMTTSLVLQLAVDVAVLFALRKLFGHRKAILIPYAVFLFTTISLPATLWWAAALNQLPQQLFTVLAVIAHLNYLQHRRVRSLLLAVAFLVAGLAFSEKTVFAVPLLLALTWLFCTPGPLISALFLALRRHWAAWAAYAVVLVPYLIYYQTQVSTPVHAGATTRQAVDLLDVMLRRTILPGLLGGPWHWEPIGWVDSFASPPAALQVLAAGLVIGFVVATARRRVNAYRAWLLAGLYLALLYVTLLLTRVQVTSSSLGAEYRYYTDFAFVAALAVGLATLRTRGPLVAGSNKPVLGRVRPLTSGPVLDTEAVPVAAVMVVGLLATSAVYSAYTFGERWTANPGRPYFANARQAIGHLGPDAVVYNGVVPSEVVWRLLWPANLPARLLGPVGLEAMPMGEGTATRRLLEFSQQGTLQDSRVSGPVSKPGPAPGCGYSVRSDRTTRIPLEGKAFYWNWVVQFDLVAPTATTLTVRAGRTTAEVPVAAGQRSLYVGVVGEVDAVTVSRESGGHDVCVRSLIVGLPQPPAW